MNQGLIIQCKKKLCAFMIVIKAWIFLLCAFCCNESDCWDEYYFPGSLKSFSNKLKTCFMLCCVMLKKFFMSTNYFICKEAKSMKDIKHNEIILNERWKERDLLLTLATFHFTVHHRKGVVVWSNISYHRFFIRLICINI